MAIEAEKSLHKPFDDAVARYEQVLASKRHDASCAKSTTPRNCLRAVALSFLLHPEVLRLVLKSLTLPINNFAIKPITTETPVWEQKFLSVVWGTVCLVCIVIYISYGRCWFFFFFFPLKTRHPVYCLSCLHISLAILNFASR